MREEEQGKATVYLNEPPRLLLGVALLFWGAMHDRPVVALLTAILVEGAHWTKTRWAFGEKAFSRSWQISLVLLAISGLNLLQEENIKAGDFLKLLSWLPVLMLPTILAQQYGRSAGMPTVTFSFIARRKAAADRKAGRPVSEGAVRLGYPYFLLVLITAGMGVGSLLAPGFIGQRYIIGGSLLMGWAVFQMRGKRRRPLAWVVGYLGALAMAGVMSVGLVQAYQFFKDSFSQGGGRQRSTSQTQTSIGQIRELQMSPKVLWRYDHLEGEQPRLLKVRAYNEPLGDLWQSRTRPINAEERIEPGREYGGDFERLYKGTSNNFAFDLKGLVTQDTNSRGRLKGLVSDSELLPQLPHHLRYEDLPAEEVGVNSMGVIQVRGLNQGAIATLLCGSAEVPPIQLDPSDLDLTYPLRESSGLTDFLREVGLEVPGQLIHPARALLFMSQNRARPPEVSEADFWEIKTRLSAAFQQDFTYSLFLEGDDENAPITEFLKEDRKGHCEYFASSTAMLLRRLGVPCRYVVGMALQEQDDDGEWIMRGHHSHAWVEAYVGGTWQNESVLEEPLWRCRGGRWVTVDLTPPDWENRLPNRPWYQGVSDAFNQLKTSFLIWSARPTVADGTRRVLTGLGTFFFLYLVYYLTKTRGQESVDSWEETVRKNSILADFERWLAKRGSSRPKAMAMGKWLRQELAESGGALAGIYEDLVFGGRTEVSEADLREEVSKAKKEWLSRAKK